jgi:hypothetical protein
MNYEQKIWLRYFIIVLIIFLIIRLLPGCSVEHKAHTKASWLIAHDKLGEFCNLLYPPKPDSIVTRDTTLYDTIPGESVIIHDSVRCKDSIIYRDVKCPPAQVIIKTLLKDTTIYRENPNQRAAYESQLRGKDNQIKAKDDIIINQQVTIDKEDKWKVWFIILASLNVLSFVFRFFVIKRPI